jgi:DNA primase
VIPQGFIQDLIARADIVEVVGRSVQLKKAGINYKGLCPFHGEKTPSFIVSPSRQTYHCFGCGAHGNAVGFLMEHTGLDFVEAVRELAQSMGVQVTEEERSPQERERAAQARQQQTSLVELLAKAAAHWRRQLKDSTRAVAYLKGRGLSGEVAARFGLGYAPPGWHGLASVFGQYDDPRLVEAGLVILSEREPATATTSGQAEGEQRRYDRFRDRVMFPIRNPKGEVIGFGGRVMDGGEPKYLNSPETPVFVKGRELYGLFEARTAIRERGYVLVTEGYMDVVALAQLGFPNAVATLGTACTAEHVQKLVRFTDRVVFSFDGDAAGRRAAGRALEAVLPHATDTRSFRFLFLPPEHDPDSYVRAHGAAAFEQCIDAAVPLSRQLLDVVQGDGEIDTSEGRAKMLASAQPLFMQLPAGLLREQVLQALAERGGLGLDVLSRHWGLAQAAARGDERPPSLAGSTRREARRPAIDPRDGEGRPTSDSRKPWAGRDGGRSLSRWKDDPGQGPRRAPPRTATLLDRAAWLLLHQAELLLQLPADQHEVLAQQPAPYGEFFTALERLLHDQGPLPCATLLADLPTQVSDDAAMRLLLTRLAGLHELGSEAEPRAELDALLTRLRLQAVEDELNLLIESGDLSEAARARHRALNAQLSELKRPKAGPV